MRWRKKECSVNETENGLVEQPIIMIRGYPSVAC